MNTIMIIFLALIIKVDPMTALSVAKLESGLDDTAMGDKNMSYGLFQIKCDTARGVGFRGGCGELRDARINTVYGLLYLKSKLNKHGLRAGLSAYNAGRPLYKAKNRFVNGKYVDIVSRKIKCLQRYKPQFKLFTDTFRAKVDTKTLMEFRYALLKEKKLVKLVSLSLTGLLNNDTLKELDKLDIGHDCK